MCPSASSEASHHAACACTASLPGHARSRSRVPPAVCPRNVLSLPLLSRLARASESVSDAQRWASASAQHKLRGSASRAASSSPVHRWRRGALRTSKSRASGRPSAPPCAPSSVHSLLPPAQPSTLKLGTVRGNGAKPAPAGASWGSSVSDATESPASAAASATGSPSASKSDQSSTASPPAHSGVEAATHSTARTRTSLRTVGPRVASSKAAAGSSPAGRPRPVQGTGEASA
mmetsp:Transcript_41488/g.134031  ORF Transcript_41488/g.134031 Transcript_41488/m.134031 type:complete len:233 (+) Transcript_41488:168-866(+)